MCLAAGCTAFLTKPIKQEVLLQAIKEHSIVAPLSSKDESSRMDTILVRGNPKFADRIPAYLQNCRQNAIAMLDALDRVDFETVTILGHQMRGSGGAYMDSRPSLTSALPSSRRPRAPTPTRRASGWANCPATWIVSRPFPTSPSFNLATSIRLMRNKEISNPDTDIGSKKNWDSFHKMDLPPEWNGMPVCTENFIRVDEVTESPKVAQ